MSGPGQLTPGQQAARERRRASALQASRASAEARRARKASGEERKNRGLQDARAKWRRDVEKAVQWAAKKDAAAMGKAKGLKRTLLQLKLERPDQFMRVLIPLLPSAESKSPSGRLKEEEEAPDRAREELDKILARFTQNGQPSNE
jgi:hypothetical protein